MGERYVDLDHFRNAANPTAESYKDKPLANHFRLKHTSTTDLLEIVDRATSLVNSKIKEAKFLINSKPTLNDRS
jgi:hypothetical protein